MQTALKTLKDGVMGLSLLADLNWDRVLTVVAVICALLAGSQLGQF